MQMVAETVTMLLARIDGDDAGSPHIVLGGELIIRGSTRRYGDAR
jgi:DNA-binding LacI/PurR family transcriptional regulator